MDLFWWIYILFLKKKISVARGNSDSDSDGEVPEAVEENSDLGIVGEDIQDFGDGNFSPALGVETVSVFPKNSARCENSFWWKSIYCFCCYWRVISKLVSFFFAVVTAGEETELLVGVKNDGNEMKKKEIWHLWFAISRLLFFFFFIIYRSYSITTNFLFFFLWACKCTFPFVVYNC